MIIRKDLTDGIKTSTLNETKYSRMDQERILKKVFKGCFPQILLGPFMNTLSQMYLLEVSVLINSFMDQKKDSAFGCGFIKKFEKLKFAYTC